MGPKFPRLAGGYESGKEEEGVVAGRVVVVTGASGGVGRAVARAFGATGDAVALLARGEAGLDAAAKDVEAAGGRALVVPVDVADAAAIDAAAARVSDELGSIDVWVNDAFTSVFAPFTEISAEEYRRVTEVSYLGYVYGTQAALRSMRPRNRGVIVQVGSALAYRGIPLQSAYCGAKHAIQGFTESARCELRHEGSRVRITMVQLPAVNTPQFSWVLSRLPRHPQPVPPIYQPEVAARAVLWAAEHDRRELVGRCQHGRDHGGQRGDAGSARSLSGPHRLRQSADRGARFAGSAGQPVAARRRRLGSRRPR